MVINEKGSFWSIEQLQEVVDGFTGDLLSLYVVT